MDLLLAQGGSDLHLAVGIQPIIRVAGTLTPILAEKPLTNDDVKNFIDIMLRPEHKQRFENTQEVDFSYGYAEKARFRGNGFVERGKYAVALRLIPKKIPNVLEAGLFPGSGAGRAGEDDHACGADREDKQRARRAHRHDRGPYRIFV
jgi:twitching motility protein PilT